MAATTRISEDNILQAVVLGSLLLAGIAGALSAWLVSARFGASLFAGGLLATANFLWIRRGLEAALRILPANPSRFAVARYLVRLAIMAMFLYLLIVRMHAHVIGVMLGLSVIVINIIVFSIYLSTRKGG